MRLREIVDAWRHLKLLWVVWVISTCGSHLVEQEHGLALGKILALLTLALFPLAGELLKVDLIVLQIVVLLDVGSNFRSKGVSRAIQAIISIDVFLDDAAQDRTHVVVADLFDLGSVEAGSSIPPLELTCLGFKRILDKLRRVLIIPTVVIEQVNVRFDVPAHLV